MEWVAIAAVVIAIWYWRRKRKTRQNPHIVWRNTHDFGGYTIETSATLREIDPNAYRFDNTAFPQYRITYADEDGVVTDREIYVDNWYKRGGITYYKCWCFLRDERRTFRSDRILDTINVQTGRRIKDISAYVMRG